MLPTPNYPESFAAVHVRAGDVLRPPHKSIVQAVAGVHKDHPLVFDVSYLAFANSNEVSGYCKVLHRLLLSHRLEE